MNSKSKAPSRNGDDKFRTAALAIGCSDDAPVRSHEAIDNRQPEPGAARSRVASAVKHLEKESAVSPRFGFLSLHQELKVGVSPPPTPALIIISVPGALFAAELSKRLQRHCSKRG